MEKRKIEINQEYYNLHTKALYRIKQVKGLKVIITRIDTNEEMEMHISNIKNISNFIFNEKLLDKSV